MQEGRVPLPLAPYAGDYRIGPVRAADLPRRLGRRGGGGPDVISRAEQTILTMPEVRDSP